MPIWMGIGLAKHSTVKDTVWILLQWDVVRTQEMRVYCLPAHRQKFRGLIVEFFCPSSSPEDSQSWDFDRKIALTRERHGSTYNLLPDSSPNSLVTFYFWANLPSKKWFSKVPTLESGSSCWKSKICINSAFYVKIFEIAIVDQHRDGFRERALGDDDSKLRFGRIECPFHVGGMLRGYCRPVLWICLLP
mgnify:CR=1 FL=1